MKKLTKLRLINWHYFQNIEVEFGMLNFLTGVNAAGKSTVIDAMQVVLLGDTYGRSFNKAANEKSGRTLKGYLRCEVGDNEDGSTKFLRTGRFTSYIALEFFDDVLNQPFTVGVVFDVFDDGSEQHRFFYLEDKFPENHFLIDRVPMSQKTLQEYFSANYNSDKFIFCDSNAQYQGVIKEKFGNLKEKYFSLFKKAVSFIPITNIESFITEYVCDVPNDINIESMKSNITSYERLKIEADEMMVKIKSLEEIHNIYQQIVDKRKEMSLASYISKRIFLQISSDYIASYHNDISRAEERIAEIDSSIREIESDIEALEEQKQTLIAYKFSNDNYKLTQDLRKSYQDAERKVREIEENLQALYTRINTYVNNFLNYENKINSLCLSSAEHTDDNKVLESLKHLELECANLDKALMATKEALNLGSLTPDLFKNFSSAISDFKNVVIEEYSVLKSSIGMVINRISQQKQTLVTSSSGKYYDDAFLNVRNQLKLALEDHFHEKVDVLIYADLVDIRNKRWINAIEGFISAQKLNLFVKDKYYEVANKLLPGIMKRNGYHRTGLVDERALAQHNFEAEENSLAEEIITDHKGARDYTNFLIGRLTKCETFQEARESGHGICPSCIGYRSFASFVIPDRLYRYPLIGRSVSREVRDQRMKELDLEAKSIGALKELVDTLSEAKELDIMSQSEQMICLNQLDSSDLLASLKNNLKQYEEELKAGTSQDLQTTDTKIKRIDTDIEQLNNQKNELILEKGALQNNIKVTKEEKIPQEVKKSSAYMEEIENSFDTEWVEQTAKPTFDNELASNLSLADIRLKYDDIYSKVQNRIRNLNEQLKDRRSSYVITYKLSYDITKEDNDDFERELTTLRDVKLPQYLVKIEDAHQKATKEFKDDFIFKLKTAIEQARLQIGDLNEALKDAHFGQDSYEFTIQPNPQYIDYYNMITDEMLLDVDSDDEAFLLKHKDVMDNLFRLISDGEGKDKAEQVAQNIEKFTDYRSYLIFDLKVKKPDGAVYSLARNIKKASGGETQTPFYISILASFSQLYRVKANKNISNCIRLVIFDEAFSKMDRNRIVESIKILKDFDLQVIISAPPEKVLDISTVVDRTLVVTRKPQENVSHMDPFVYHGK